jgi:alginate O-acetyltransferase complex protein AlgI
MVLLLSSAIDYWISRAMENAAGSRRKYWAAAICTNIGLLGYFKYANFVVEPILGPLALFHGFTADWQHVALPIGISFFTFQKVSYLVDVYRGTVRAAQRFTDYALYVALFPQLIAGPIVRYHDVNQQLEARTHSLDRFVEGIYRFCLGLGKKVLIANNMAYVADHILAQPVEQLPALYAWCAILAYSMQIFFDFAGYSDMAIGLGRMIGFRFLENFNRPYVSCSITEFWRRWHISLSNWMLEYLYVPLGGNRCPHWRNYLNLWIVFLISGFWHGANWSFIVWGAYHGFFLSLEKAIGRRRLERIPRVISNPLTFLIVLFGWVIFRIESIPDALTFIKRMFAFDTIAQYYPQMPMVEWLSNRTMVVFAIAVLISFSAPARSWVPDRRARSSFESPTRWPTRPCCRRHSRPRI